MDRGGSAVQENPRQRQRMTRQECGMQQDVNRKGVPTASRGKDFCGASRGRDFSGSSLDFDRGCAKAMEQGLNLGLWLNLYLCLGSPHCLRHGPGALSMGLVSMVCSIGLRSRFVRLSFDPGHKVSLVGSPSLSLGLQGGNREVLFARIVQKGQERQTEQIDCALKGHGLYVMPFLPNSLDCYQSIHVLCPCIMCKRLYGQ